MKALIISSASLVHLVSPSFATTYDALVSYSVLDPSGSYYSPRCDDVPVAGEAVCQGSNTFADYWYSPDVVPTQVVGYDGHAAATSTELKVSTWLGGGNIISYSAESENIPGHMADGEEIHRLRSVAGFRDAWTVFGGVAGELGRLTLSFALDGFFTGFGPSVVSPNIYDSLVSLNLQNLSGGLARFDVTAFELNFDNEVDLSIDLSVPIIFGEQSSFLVFMEAMSEFNNTRITDSFATGADFFHTATLSDISVFDSSGAAVEFLLASASGDAAFESFSTATGGGSPTPVPLPAGMPLLLGGLGLMALMKQRARPSGACVA
ncbi:MAG: hypothetical protein H6903_10410 [Rhodobacteraceae bacterium]|nr:hypothetical protein [Defluviimonas sp.]MCP5355604.1 hypothetical protein [Paracoccaceae bacterium]